MPMVEVPRSVQHLRDDLAGAPFVESVPQPAATAPEVPPGRAPRMVVRAIPPGTDRQPGWWLNVLPEKGSGPAFEAITAATAREVGEQIRSVLDRAAVVVGEQWQQYTTAHGRLTTLAEQIGKLQTDVAAADLLLASTRADWVRGLSGDDQIAAAEKQLADIRAELAGRRTQFAAALPLVGKLRDDVHAKLVAAAEAERQRIDAEASAALATQTELFSAAVADLFLAWVVRHARANAVRKVTPQSIEMLTQPPALPPLPTP